jgi:hypothetical protein
MAVARCPMCHTVNEGSAPRCDRCGYEFGQSLDTLHDMLVDQLRSARLAFWTLILFDGMLFVFFALSMIFGFFIPALVATIGGVTLTMRAAKKISITKRSLLSVEKQRPQLPKATLVSG